VYELIKHRFVPDVEHPACLQSGPQTMRPKRSQCDCQETKHSCDPKKRDAHLVTMSGEVEEYQILHGLVGARSARLQLSFQIG
jgi:hypothetical protein